MEVDGESIRETPTRTVHSFVVRVWFEPREIPGVSRQMRGEVREVLGERTRRFRSYGEIAESIRELVETFDDE